MQNLTIAAVCAAGLCAAASAATFTEIDNAYFETANGWSPVGTSQFFSSTTISGDRPRSGNGSLRLETTAGNGKASATFGGTRFSNTGPVLGTLGDLAAGSISFEWLVDSATTTAGNRSPAIEFAVRNADGSNAILKWEAVYNGVGTVPTDTWTTSDISDDNFWMFNSAGGVIPQYGVTLDDWAAGESFTNSTVFDADSMVVGWAVQAGSGWSDEFYGFVDNVNVTFGNGGATYNANFELEGQVIPSPLAGVLGATGLFGVAGIRRRR